jgi:hypothetical protein
MFSTKFLESLIESEKNGTDYTYPAEDKKLLKKLFKEIYRHTGINVKYLAEMDVFRIEGSGEIISKYITEFSSESVKGLLVPQIVADKVKDCDKLILQLYLQFKSSEEYISKPGEPAPAHIYVRYDNAFRKLKPKKLAKNLLELARNPRDAFYLPFTMRMLASWKMPEMLDLLNFYFFSERLSAADFGIFESDNLQFYPPVESMRRELKFTAINGLKYFPSRETKALIEPLTNSENKDIRSAAQKSLTAMLRH